MRAPRKICTTALLGAASLLAGCAEMTSIYHSRGMPTPPSALTIDSYQRNVFTTHSPYDKDGQVRLCAEASPDTFAALSASLAAEGNATSKTANIAAAITQSGATIERTQTINLLRESMYRTCERYLSGAISRNSFVVQAARDQRTMLAVLAIEQLSRTVRPPATVLAPNGTSATVPNRALTDLVTDLREDEKAKKGKFETADSEFKKVGGPEKCSGDKPSEAAAAAEWQKCEDAEKIRKDALSDYETATGRVNQALGLGGNSGTTSAGSTSGQSNAGGNTSPPSEASLATIAREVSEIAQKTSIDESLMFCIASLSDPDGWRRGDASATAVGAFSDQTASEMATKCLSIVERRAQLDEDHVRQLFKLPGDRGGTATDAPPPPIPGYEAFRDRLLVLLAATAEADVPTKIAAFEKRAGLGTIDTGVPARCKKRAPCILKVNGRGYFLAFLSHGLAMSLALDNW